MARGNRDEAQAPAEAQTPDETPEVNLYAADVLGADEEVALRAEKPNPLEAVYAASQGRQLRVPPKPHTFSTEGEAIVAVLMLRRAATKVKGGLRVGVKPEVTEKGSGFAVYFRSAERKQRTGPVKRNYTSADVRAWAAEQGMSAPEGKKIPDDVRRAYRLAHGYPVKTDNG